MLRQINLLTRMGLCNLFGINEVRHTRDSGKKQRFALLCGAWILIGLLLMSYMILLSLAYIGMGLADVLPMYFYTVASMVILFFSFFKAGDMVFSLSSYELQASWPVSTAAIVISRFMIMYVTDLLFSLLVMIPGFVIYGIKLHPAVTFYIYGMIGTLFLPMLPLCIALLIGAVIRAIGSRMKHKSVGIALLTLVFSTAIVAVSMIYSNNMENMDMSRAKGMAVMVSQMLCKVYPPAWFFGKAVVEGRFLWILGLCAGVSALFLCVVGILQKYFVTICSLLNATSAKNNYKMGAQQQKSRIRALWQRELRRYFASSIYVSNTLIGYILAVIASAALLFFGPDKMEMMAGIPGLVYRLWPLLLGFMMAMMPTTACSISMEGKTLWRLQSLPLPAKEVYDGKILANLSLAAPFYVVSVILSIMALRPKADELVFIILVPAFYIAFSAVAGLTVNMALPLLKWDSEVQVVKQSGATFGILLVAFAVWLIPTGILFAFPQLPASIVFLSGMVILGILTTVLYVKIQRQKLDF
mgnify:FL=1